MVLLQIGLTESLITSICLSAAFVGSLYVWKAATSLDRDHPTQIKRRLISIFLVCVISLFAVLWWQDPNETKGPDRWRLLGLTTVGLWPATLLPLLLTMILFLGPLFVQFLSGIRLPQLHTEQQKLLAFRNYFIAPMFEEFVFRACVCTLLISAGWGSTFTILCSPLLFGIAHTHHVIDLVKSQGYSLGDSIQVAVHQLLYTTIFGQFAAFLFVRTGNFVAPFISHCFCNMMGVPRLEWAFNSAHPLFPMKTGITVAFVCGLVLWIVALFPMTNPAYFQSWFAEYGFL